MADAWIDTTPDTGTPWSEVSGAELAMLIAGTDPTRLSGSETVEMLKACDRLTSWAQAQTARVTVAAAEAVGCELDKEPLFQGIEGRESRDRWVADELATALHIAPNTARYRLFHAQTIVVDHPRLIEALQSGHLTWSQSLVLSDAVRGISADTDERVQELGEALLDAVLPTADRYPPARLRERTRHLLMRLDAEAAAARRKKNVRERTGVHVWNDEDGLATLGITGPAIDIHALKKRIVDHADALKNAHEAHLAQNRDESPLVDELGHIASPPEERNIGQWRLAAALAAVGLAPLGIPAASTDPTSVDGARTIPGLDIRIVIDLPTALGLAHNPADMPGYGPLDPDLARQLAASADWKRWITDPITGHLLDDGNRRLPTAALARFINARDARCDAPCCGRVARLDIDHIPTYAKARATRADTLTRTCVRHNRSREKARWFAPEQHTWVTALGRQYTTLGHQVLPAPDPPDDEPPPF
jgi:hypothetical protein